MNSTQRNTSCNGVSKIRYPWEEWFRKKNFVLRRGVDYTGRTYAMAQQVRNAASKNNTRVSIKIYDEYEYLRVQVMRQGQAELL